MHAVVVAQIPIKPFDPFVFVFLFQIRFCSFAFFPLEFGDINSISVVISIFSTGIPCELLGLFLFGRILGDSWGIIGDSLGISKGRIQSRHFPSRL